MVTGPAGIQRLLVVDSTPWFLQALSLEDVTEEGGGETQ